MNLYLRYFDSEVLVHNYDEAISFLRSLKDFECTPAIEEEIRVYVESDILYPKRYKVKSRSYFIVIKTYAETMEDFKAKKALNPKKEDPKMSVSDSNSAPAMKLSDVREGWYEGTLDFKRVVQVPVTGKFEYKDTRVVVQCKAVSGFDCYDRIIEYLSDRVDSRSQFPSAKGKNFQFKYLGAWK